VLEVFNLAKALEGVLTIFVRPAHVSPGVLREHEVALFSFDNHKIIIPLLVNFIGESGIIAKDGN
jgi:hypothetical protein